MADQATPLDQALRGVKLGVQAKFARDAAKKLNSTMGAQLRGHLQLYEYAVALSPGEIESQSSQDLKDAVQALSAKVKDWPDSVQKAMYQRHSQTLLSACLVDVSDRTLESLMEVIKPFADAEEAVQPLDILHPKLRWMAATKKEKQSLFQEMVVTDLLTPMIEEGETSASKFKKVVGKLATSLENYLLQDVPDEMLSGIAELNDFVSACKVLVMEDPFAQMTDISLVQGLKQKFRTVGKGPMVSLANNLCASKYYHDMVEGSLRETLKLKTHETKIAQVNDVCTGTFSDDGTMEEDCQALHTGVKNMAFLMEEILLETLKPLSVKLVQKLFDFWDRAWPSCGVEKAGLVKIESLQALVQESVMSKSLLMLSRRQWSHLSWNSDTRASVGKWLKKNFWVGRGKKQEEGGASSCDCITELPPGHGEVHQNEAVLLLG